MEKELRSTADLRVAVSYMKVSELRAAEYNPRKWDQASINQLKESIGKFGMIDPIIANKAVSRENVVIGGHFRLFVAKELGFKEVPVVYVDIPELEKEKELNLRLNRNTGQWDMELLKEFDINLLLDVGFDDSDLAPIWDQLETESDGFDLEKKLREIKATTVKPGDLYMLGSHFLLCGDSTDLGQVEHLMDGKKANIVYSDPPYNIRLDYSKGISTSGKYGGQETDKKSSAQYKDFLKTTLENALSVSEPDAHFFYYCDETCIGTVQGLYEELGIANRRVCLWVKNNLNMTPGVAYQ
jgi:hypothetical protein